MSGKRTTVNKIERSAGYIALRVPDTVCLVNVALASYLGDRDVYVQLCVRGCKAMQTFHDKDKTSL